MSNLHAFIKDLAASASLGGIVVLLLLSLLAIVRQYQTVRARLREFAGTLPQKVSDWKRPSLKSVDQGLWGEVERVLVFRPDPSRPTIVVRASPEDGLQEHIRDAFRRGFFGAIIRGIGEHLTAIALLATFVLLGWVLIGDIHEAVQETDKLAASALAQGLQKMGAKFFVSAAGIGGAWVFTVAQDFALARLRAHVRAAVRTVGDSLVLVDAYEAMLANDNTRTLEAISRGVLQVHEGVQKLESIEVSVQGIGENVVHHVQTVMRQQVADVICESIKSMEDTVGGIANTLAENLRTSLAQGLVNVQRAIEGQSQGNIEGILARLGDVVSGGFRSESQDMARQLSQLTESLPRLEMQFSSLGERIGQSAGAWAEQGQQSIAQLTTAVSTLVAQFDGVKTSIDAAASRMLSASEEGAQQAASQARALGQEVLSLRGAATEQTAELERRARGIAELMNNIQLELATSQKTIQEALAAMSAGTTQQKALLQTFSTVAQQLVEGGRRIEATVQKQPEILARESELLRSQREAIERTGAVLKEVFDQHASSLTHQAQTLAETWSAQATHIKNAVQGVSDSLQESVEDLKDGLNSAVSALKNGALPAA